MRFRLRDIDGKATVRVVYTRLDARPLPGRPRTCISRASSRTASSSASGTRSSRSARRSTHPSSLAVADGRARARSAHRLPRPLALRARRPARSRPGRGRRRLAASAQNALLAAFVAAVVAAGVLLAALVRHDFSFVYAADFTSTEAAARSTRSPRSGAARQGSLLLWLLVLTGLRARRGPLQPLRGARGDRVGGARLGLVASFFALLLVAVASPFDTQTRRSTAPGSTRASRTRTWSPTRRCSTSATSA